MRVLIVDDEAPARERLRRLLLPFDDVQVAGEARDAEQALQQVAALAPDAVFLDVQMPGASGLDVAASLPEPPPALVFVTAHDRYALQAFDNAALDYLLKPVEPDRLARAVQRLRTSPRIAERASVGALQLLIAERGRTHVVRCTDIEWLQAADNYVELQLGGRSLLMRRTLAGLLRDLGPAFVQVHRSAAVALAAVKTVRPRERGDAVVVLASGAQVPCSRQYRAALLARLQAPSL
jgi:two-component system LytT family response regulator